jgi:mono/diheme cytochrome c family protein
MMQIPITSISQSYGYAAAAAFLLLFALVAPRRYNIAMAILLMVCGLMFFGKFEWFRESIRKPYVISGYMFGNAVEVAHATTYRLEGFLKHITFRSGDDGEDLFNHACRSCHTINAYQPLKPAFDGTDKEFIAAIIKGVNVVKGNMPPFLGTNEEADMLATYLHKQSDKRPIEDIYNLSGVALGQKVYEIRCGKCHVMGGYDDESASLIGLGEDGYNELLDMAAEYGEEMPAFTGDKVERAALIEYLKTLKEKNESSKL